MALRVAATAAWIAAALLLPAPAGAATIIDPVGGPQEFVPASLDAPPRGFSRTGREVLAASDRTRAARRLRERERRLDVRPYARPASRSWAVTYARGERILLAVHVDDFSGGVTDVWDGLTANFALARGEERGLSHIFYEWYVWIPFAVLFLAPFIDLRRPFRLLHLDLLVFLGFGVSHLFYDQSRLELSVPLVYPVLAYLLVRMLMLAWRPVRRATVLVPHVPLRLLAAGALLLAGLRVLLNLLEPSVIDVGYVSVIGADRIAHGEELYVFNDAFGDTYGPIAYLAYVPFEMAFPFTGRFDFLPAAHAASITFDLLTGLALVLLGRRLRAGAAGTALGVALAYAWFAYPYSLFTLLANPNDGLVALLLVTALVVVTSPAGRGAMLAAAALTKFAPAALVPLFATGLRPRLRDAVVFAAAAAIVVAGLIWAFLPDGGLRELYDTTLGYQLSRESPFSPWGQHSSLEPLQAVLTAAAVLLGVGSALLPRGPRSAAQVCALSAAVLIATQLPAVHWFYFYVVWFAPFAFAAIFCEYRTGKHAIPVTIG